MSLSACHVWLAIVHRHVTTECAPQVQACEWGSERDHGRILDTFELRKPDVRLRMCARSNFLHESLFCIDPACCVRVSTDQCKQSVAQVVCQCRHHSMHVHNLGCSAPQIILCADTVYGQPLAVLHQHIASLEALLEPSRSVAFIACKRRSHRGGINKTTEFERRVQGSGRVRVSEEQCEGDPAVEDAERGGRDTGVEGQRRQGVAENEMGGDRASNTEWFFEECGRRFVCERRLIYSDVIELCELRLRDKDSHHQTM